MKNSKRIITVILALVMMLSTVSFSALASNFSDITDEKVGEAVAKLVANGIITGYEDGTFRPENQITRAEFAAVVTRMKGVANTVAPDAKTGFADLDNDESRAWARPYVKAAVDLKIINGFEDGTFRAGEPVTYEQAVKMLVCAAGYEIVAQSEYNKAIAANPNATWSAGYIAAANKHGFTKGAVTGKISEPASRGIVALLTSNAIDVPPLQQNQDGSVVKGDETSNDEKQVQDIKGVVTGTYYTGIDSPVAGISLNEIKITTVENGEEIYELSDDLAKTIDFEDLIGKGVTAYYNTLDRQITSITKSNNKITLIDEKDVIRPIADGEIKYYTDKKKATSVDLDGYTIIYNGKYISSDSDIIEDLDDEFTNGTIELVETTGRKVAKITSYDVYVADGSLNKTTGKINFKYGEGSYTFESSTDDRPVIYVDGKVKEYDSLTIKAFNVINLMEAPRVGGNVRDKMYVTTKAYSGKVTAQLDKERIVELGDKEMVLTNSYNDFDGNGKAPFALGDTYKYYLDYTGQIAAVDYNPLTSSEYELGYVIDADREKVQLISSDSEFILVTMKDKVKIDGVSVNNEDVKETLEEIAGELYGEGTCSQPVKYIIANDLVSAIDTAANSEGDRATEIGSNSDDTFIFNESGNASTGRSSVSIGGKTYQASTATKVIYVPDNRTADYDYSIMIPSKAFAAGGTREVKIFGADPSQRTKQATMILIYGIDPAYDFVATTPYMLVSEVDRANNQISGYPNGGTGLDTITISEDKFKVFGDELVGFEDVNKGDVIRYVEDASGVIAIEMIYDASEGGYLYQENANDDKYTLDEKTYYQSFTSTLGELRVRYVEAFDIIGTTQLSATTAIGDYGADGEVEKQKGNRLITYKINSSTNVFIIDEDGNLVLEDAEYKYDNISITAGSSSEIIVFETDITNHIAKTIYIVK